MKICNHCKIEKEVSEFHKNSTRKDGLCVDCKVCCADRQRSNKDSVNKKTARWRHAHKEQHNEAVRNWRIAHPEKQQESCRNWRKKNPHYTRDRRLVDPAFRIIGNIRRRVHHAISGDFKAGSVIKDIGCTPEELIQHLQNQFTEGMTWKNYGEWEIDHIMPLSLYNLSDRKQFLEANHFSNLQPLWSIDNKIKGNKVVKLI